MDMSDVQMKITDEWLREKDACIAGRKWFREQFWDVKKVGRSLQLVKPKTGPRRTVADLMDCPWCFGMWAAASITFFYLITPYAVFPVVLLALSGVATFLQLLSNLIGNKAVRLEE